MLNAFGNEHLNLLVHKSFFYAFNFGTKFCNRRRRGCKRLQIAKQKVHFLLMREFSPFVLVTFFRKTPTLKLFHFCSFSTVFSRFPHQEPQAEMFLRIEGFQVTFSDGEKIWIKQQFPPRWRSKRSTKPGSMRSSSKTSSLVQISYCNVGDLCAISSVWHSDRMSRTVRVVWVVGVVREVRVKNCSLIWNLKWQSIWKRTCL